MQKINAAFVTHTRGYTKLKRCVGSVRVRFKTSEERDALRKKGISLSLSLSRAEKEERGARGRRERASRRERGAAFQVLKRKKGTLPREWEEFFSPY